MVRAKVVLCGVSLLLAGAAGCQPRVPDGEYRCNSNNPSSCPEGMLCLSNRNSHYCYSERVGTCGDDEIQPGEQCDRETFGDVSHCVAPNFPVCRTDCTLYCTRCGDGVVEKTGDGTGEECDDENQQSLDGCSSTCNVEVPQWELWESPLGRGQSGAAMAYDSANNKTVLFGGFNGQLFLDGTWERVGGRWFQRLTTPSPPHRTFHAMTYDPVHARVLLFGGGGTANQVLNDLWAYEASEGVWELLDSGPAPPPRAVHAMAFCPNLGLVVFGGATADGSGIELLGDTWVYRDGVWTETSAVDGPSARRFARMVCLGPAQDRMLLFGGSNKVVTALGDTWLLDEDGWTELAPPTSPAPRFAQAMVYDSTLDRVVLFGGSADFGPQEFRHAGDTWVYENHNWHELALDASPLARTNVPAIYNSHEQHMMIYGGWLFDDSHAYDTWTFDGTEWADVSETLPVPREWTSLAFDAGRGVLVLFGGWTEDATLPRDTWEFDGSQWYRVDTAVSPAGRVGGAMSYSPELGGVMLYGGFTLWGESNDTWLFDGTDWLNVSQSTDPPRRWGAAMTYDASQQRQVLFGGWFDDQARRDTWVHEDGQWRVLEPGVNGPPGRGFPGFAYDASRDVVVLFGGWVDDNSYLGDTWELAGATWNERSPAASPGFRRSHGMAYVPDRGRVLLFGGFGGPGPYADTWEYDGVTWTQLLPPTRPPMNHGEFLVYDSWRRRAVLYGGRGFTGDLWEFWYRNDDPVEQCGNGIDDDGDGVGDAEDPDCALAP